MKKILISGFLVVAAAVSLVITFMVDPYTAKFKKTLDNFHQNFVYIDGYFKDEFSKKIEDQIKELESKVTAADQAIKAESNKTQKAELEKQIQPDKDLMKKLQDYKLQLDSKADEMKNLTDSEIINKLVQDVLKTPADELKLKTVEALPGVKKIIDLAAEVETTMIPEVKTLYTNAKLKDLNKLYNDALTVTSDKLSTLKWIRILLLVILIAASGITFILLEAKARKSGEIKASEVI